MALEKNTTLIFNDVWQDIEDNLETEHEKARMLDIMVAFYLHGEIPVFSKAEGERIVKVVFAGMKRGAEYNNKKYEDSCYRALDKRCGNKARDYGLFKPDGKTGDIKAFIERYPEEYQKLRVETKVAEIEGDEAAAQSENVPEKVHKSGHIEEPHEPEEPLEEEPYEEEPYEEPFVDEEPEEPEEPTREEPHEEAHEEEPKKEPPKEENGIETYSLTGSQRDMLDRYKREVKSPNREYLFWSDMEGLKRDLTKMEKMIEWRKAYSVAQGEITSLYNTKSQWVLILTKDNFERLEADEVGGFINDLIEAKKPLEKIFNDDLIIEILVSLKYDIEAIRTFAEKVSLANEEIVKTCNGDAGEEARERARLTDTIFSKGKVVDNVFAVLDEYLQFLKAMRQTEADDRREQEKRDGKTEDADEELPFV